MGDNSNVFNMWLAIVGITDVLFVLVIALLGFQVMSFSTLGFDELDIRQLLPQIALVFLLVNTSIFAIDGVIAFSNGMIHALQSDFRVRQFGFAFANYTEIDWPRAWWFADPRRLSGTNCYVACLLRRSAHHPIYWRSAVAAGHASVFAAGISRTLQLPALKVYLTTIFVLFVQVVIMQLASSIFGGILQGDNSVSQIYSWRLS